MKATLPERFYTAFLEGDRWKLYLQGVASTLELTVIALILGILLGLVVAVIRTAHDQQRLGQHNPILALLNFLCKVYTTVIRGTPMMVQLLIWGFVIFKTSRNHTMVGALGLGINSGAYVAEIVRGGLMSVDIGQTEAGRSLGLSRGQTMWKIVLPQAVKAVLPTYTSEFIALIKETSVAGYIAVTELTKAGDMIRNATYNAWIPLLTVAAIYLLMTLGLTKLFGVFERRLARSDRG